MKLVCKQKSINLDNAKQFEEVEKFAFDKSEISHTLKNGLTFMAKLENGGLSAYIAIVKLVEKGYEIVDSFETVFDKKFNYVLDDYGINASCEFYLEK